MNVQITNMRTINYWLLNIICMYFHEWWISNLNDVLSRLQISNWLIYVETFILGTSMTYIKPYNYFLIWIALYTNLRCLFPPYFTSITYMSYNVWIKHYQYFCNITIQPPRRTSSLILPNTKNREHYIDRNNTN